MTLKAHRGQVAVSSYSNVRPGSLSQAPRNGLSVMALVASMQLAMCLDTGPATFAGKGSILPVSSARLRTLRLRGGADEINGALHIANTGSPIGKVQTDRGFCMRIVTRWYFHRWACLGAIKSHIFIKCSPFPSSLIMLATPGRKPLRIALEGNIAAGKSTLLRLLEDELDYVAVPEPLSKWQEVGPQQAPPFENVWRCKNMRGVVHMRLQCSEPASFQVGANGTAHCGGNLLELFYKDPSRWGYTFQTYAFLSRMMAQLDPPLDTGIVADC